MSNINMKFTKTIIRVEASDNRIIGQVNYALKDTKDEFLGLISINVSLSGLEDSSVNELHDIASQKADNLLSQLVSLLQSNP